MTTVAEPRHAQSLDAYIVSTPDTLGGRPCIDGHRIAVVHVATWRLKQGMAFEEIAETYDLPIAAFYAAIAYYYEPKADIDAREAEDDAFIEDFMRTHPSKLQAKFKTNRSE